MVKNTRRSFIKASSVTATLGVTGLAGCTGNNGDVNTLRVNFVVPVENLTSLMDIPEIQDTFDNLGEEYELEVEQVESVPSGMNELAADRLDMLLATTVDFGSAIYQEAVPEGISAIAMDFYDAHPDHYGFTVYSHSDSDITEPEDLEGGKVGVNAIETGIQAVSYKRFADVGLDPDTDIEYQEMPFPAFTSAIEDGTLDAGTYPGLFAPEPRGKGFNEVFSSHDTWGDPYPFAFIIASNNSLEEKEDAFRAWGEDYVALIDYVYNNRDEIIPMASDHFDLPESLVDNYFLTENDFYRKDAEVDSEALNSHLHELVDLGFLEEELDYSSHITNEYLP